MTDHQLAERRKAGSPETFIAGLVESGAIDEVSAQRVQRLSSESGESVCKVLVKLGLVPERELAQQLSESLGLPLATPDTYPFDPPLVEAINPAFLKEARVVPLKLADGVLWIAMTDPFDSYVVQALRMATGSSIEIMVGVPADIEAAYARLYETDPAAHATTDGEFGDTDHQDDLQRLRDLAAEAPVIRFVNQLIQSAVEMRASDIHIEPFDRQMKVRFRVDGALREVDAPPMRLKAAVTSRIKLMANLNIAERRLPQDGRIRLPVRGKEIDLRVSTVPTMHGESVVLRILDKGSIRLNLEDLGYTGSALERYLGILDRPTGIVLVTGPTGSGKTTTLYASLSRLSTPENKILTVEDPVEYELPGVNQVQVKPRVGLTFANALRALVRQDPDIILIGEIRDLETAEIAGQAALTGHKVLSTLHTNDAASSVTRLMDMGVPDFLITATLNGIVAQRLVRKLCPHCKREEHPHPELVAALRDQGQSEDPDLRVFAPQGCELCNGAGYLGRTTIHEILVMTEDLRRMILRRCGAQEVQSAAIAAGMTTMYRSGVAKVAAGETTLSEIHRVTRDI